MFVSAIADVLVDESSCHAGFMRTPLHREAPVRGQNVVDPDER